MLYKTHLWLYKNTFWCHDRFTNSKAHIPALLSHGLSNYWIATPIHPNTANSLSPDPTSQPHFTRVKDPGPKDGLLSSWPPSGVCGDGGINSHDWPSSLTLCLRTSLPLGELFLSSRWLLSLTDGKS